MIKHQVHAWINEKGFLQQVTIQDVASRLNTNSKYLAEVLLREYGAANFNVFINRLRINYLLRLLESEPTYQNYKVDSLAEHLGFRSRTTLIKAFRDITGLTPNFYIEQLKKKETAAAAFAG